MDVEGMNTYADFNFIHIFYGGGSDPALLGIEWDSESMEVINFKKHVMTFENQDIRFITSMDPNEGWRYVETVKDEVVMGWDHDYNISEDYIHPNADG